jgi:hypothetical protein
VDTRLVDRDGVSFSPPSPIVALTPLARVELLTAEPPHKLLGMLGVGEAMDVPPLPVVKDRVTTRAQRQVTTERMNVFVAAIEQRGGGERDLVRPSAIYAGGESSPLRYTMPKVESVHGTASISPAMEGGCLAGVLDIASAARPPANGRSDVLPSFLRTNRGENSGAGLRVMKG